jgi:glycosyltransferase involved in cell wall biosynthesis
MDILITALCYQVIRNTQIPLIYYSIDIDHQLIPYRFLRPLGKFLESRNIQKADFVLSINEGLREYTLRMGAVEERTAVIRAGIDPVRYNPDAVDGSHIRQQYGMQEDDFLLLFMGWLYQFSGLQEVATELAKISRDHPEMKMLVVGDGDAYGDLKKIQKDLHLNGQLILAGKQPFDTIPAFIAAADVCILPAHDNAIMHDIVPIKMYEYMAMRKPVIATRLYGIMKEFSDDNGVLYVGDPAETVARAIALKASGAVRAEGVKARRFVEKSTWDAVVDEFETTLGRFI